VLAFSVFGVDWVFLKPFIVLGLAFGGVYALSGVGLVVLYRATGVVNIAFGAIGAAGISSFSRISRSVKGYLRLRGPPSAWALFGLAAVLGGGGLSEAPLRWQGVQTFLRQ